MKDEEEKQLPRRLTYQNGRYQISLNSKNPNTKNWHKTHIASSTSKRDILQIYKECEDAEWEYNKLLEIKERYKKQHPPAKHISKIKHKYRVTIKMEYWGTYDTLDEAIQARDEILRGNTESYIQSIKRQNVPEHKKIRYIYTTPQGKFCIRKYVDGRQEHFGTFNTLQEAQNERDFLVEHNWQWDCYDLI